MNLIMSVKETDGRKVEGNVLKFQGEGMMWKRKKELNEKKNERDTEWSFKIQSEKLEGS